MTLNTVLVVLHLLSALIWVGGMFFAYMSLRPTAAAQLEPPERLQLWVGVFKKFFPYVWVAIILLPLTGYMMIFDVWKSMGNSPLYVHIMNGLGMVMILIYLHIYFAPFKRLKEAVTNQNWPEGAGNLNTIRKMIAINMTIGLLVVVVGSAGRTLI